jgi:hypothetical protein
MAAAGEHHDPDDAPEETPENGNLKARSPAAFFVRSKRTAGLKRQNAVLLLFSNVKN